MTPSDAQARVFDSPDATQANLPPHTMELIIQRARITGQLTYVTSNGRRQVIPVGPCLVEVLSGRTLDVIWGVDGQRSAALSIEEIQTAQDLGYLVLLG